MTDSPRPDSFRRTLADALGTADLRRVQLSWALSSFGQWAFFVILAVYAYEQGGATAVALAALVRMVPAGLAAPIAGLVIDRSSRRDVLLATDLARTLALAGIAVAVAVEAPLAVVFVLSAVFTVLQAAHVPAQAALFPALANTPRQLAASNAVSSSVENAGVLVGSILGGVLVAATSAEGAFAVTAGLYAVAAWPLARLPRDPVPAHREAVDEEGPLRELMSGFRTVIAQPNLRLVVGLLSAGTFVEGAVDVLIVLLAIQLLDLGGEGVGWLNGAWGTGGLIAGAVAISLLRRGRLASMIENLSRRLTRVDATAGTAVVREGEEGERFYVIAAGEFEVASRTGRFPSLAAGDVFGEIALLRDVPRTATVTARTDGQLYALDRNAFLTAVSGHRFTTRQAASIADERSGRAAAARDAAAPRDAGI